MEEFAKLIIPNLLEFVVSLILAVVSCFLFPWIRRVAAPFIRETVVPWLKEKRLYCIVQHFVEAAEKLAENNKIDKKEYVISMLKEKNVEITPEIEAYIESAVKDLDLSISGVVGELNKAFRDDGEEEKSQQKPEKH